MCIKDKGGGKRIRRVGYQVCERIESVERGSRRRDMKKISYLNDSERYEKLGLAHLI